MNLFRAVRFFHRAAGVLCVKLLVGGPTSTHYPTHSSWRPEVCVCVCLWKFHRSTVKKHLQSFRRARRASPPICAPHATTVSARTVRPSVDAASAYGSSGVSSFAHRAVSNGACARAIVSSPDRQRACATTRLLSRSGQKSSILCGGACLRSPAGVWADRGGGSLRAITICGCARRERGRRIRF